MNSHIPEPYPNKKNDNIKAQESISDALHYLSKVKVYTLSEEQLKHLKNAQLSLEEIHEEFNSTQSSC